MELVQLKRNPFGRYTVVRVRVDPVSCSWCGQRGRFRYGHDPDAGRFALLSGIFCSKSCCESYHDLTLE
jgi:hypothetical protein